MDVDGVEGGGGGVEDGGAEEADGEEEEDRREEEEEEFGGEGDLEILAEGSGIVGGQGAESPLQAG